MSAGAADGRTGLSGNALKLLAVLLMVADHFALLPYGALCDVWVSGGLLAWESLAGPYYVLRTAGRLAFPIFAFLAAEGALRTRDPRRHLGRLAIFAALSEIPFDLAVSGAPFFPGAQNVLFTLLLGVAALTWVRRFEKRPVLAGVGALAAALLSLALRTDYQFFGVLLILVFGLLRSRPAAMFLLGGLTLLLQGAANYLQFDCLPGSPPPEMAFLFAFNLLYELAGTLCFPMLYAYNGRSGRRTPRYLFYAFYPAQFLALWGAQQLILWTGGLL